MAKMHDSAARRRSLVLRTIYALCLLGATYNHWIDIYRHGFFNDHGMFPKSVATFWTMLAVLDPATVILLFTRRNYGVAATVAIIVTDVICNVWITARYFPPLLHGLAGAPLVIDQIAFMLFVLITAPFAWRLRSKTSV